MSCETASTNLVNPYLFFSGNCAEAIAFYRQAVGAEVIMQMQYKDSPMPQGSPGCAPMAGDKIMHARIKIGGSTIMMSDGPGGDGRKFDGFSLSLTVATVADADRYFKALVEGGHATMPLAETFFSPRFGMLQDRFGVLWMVYVAPAQPAH